MITILKDTLSYTLLFLFLLMSMICPSAEASAIIRHIGISDGLSGDRIFSLAQDDEGFIWVVSYWGVDRYDGRIAKTYHPKHDGEVITHLLYHTKIHSFRNQIILGEQNGLFFTYNAQSDDFVEIVDLRNLTGQNNLMIKDFCPTTEGIYIATNHGLYNYNNNCLQLMSQQMDISAIGIDGKNHIYYVANGQLIYLNGDKSMTIAELNDVARFIHGMGMRIYIGTNDNGLYIWDLSSQKLSRSTAPFPKCHLTAIADGSTGELIIGTDGAGCFIYDAVNDSIIANYSESTGIMPIGNAVMDVLHDKDSNIWVATFNGALSMIHHDDSRFSTLSANHRMPGLEIHFCKPKMASYGLLRIMVFLNSILRHLHGNII